MSFWKLPTNVFYFFLILSLTVFRSLVLRMQDNPERFLKALEGFSYPEQRLDLFACLFRHFCTLHFATHCFNSQFVVNRLFCYDYAFFLSFVERFLL